MLSFALLKQIILFNKYEQVFFRERNPCGMRI